MMENNLRNCENCIHKSLRYHSSSGTSDAPYCVRVENEKGGRVFVVGLDDCCEFHTTREERERRKKLLRSIFSRLDKR
jgi:hypothetical protein